MNIPSQKQELRLFISSTFRDLQDEREYLIKKIFPEIRALCRSRGVTFTEVDLRWGLTDEQQRLGRIIRTCLEEIDRCRPFFIGIIGKRYGWSPEYHEVMMDPELLDRYPWIEELSLEGGSILEMEFTHGALMQHNPDIVFYRRTDEYADSDDPERLNKLIERIERNGYAIKTFTHLEELGESVRSDLLRIIDERWSPNALPSPLESERMMHRAFEHSRRHAYIPNPSNTQTFLAWLESGTTPLVVSAESGMGKSAFMAWASSEYHRKNPSGFAIAHYIGASNDSTDHTAMIRRIIAEIQSHFKIDDDIPATAELETAFPEWLARLGSVSSGVPSLILIDALDQFSEYSRTLSFLPKNIPENVRLIVSCRDSDVLTELREFGWEELRLRPLSVREREAIVTRYLAEYHKSLPSDLLALIGNDDKSSSPLFLRTLAEELRLHGEHESLSDHVTRCLSARDIEDLFVQLLERMESDYGERIVRSVTTALALSRSGMAEHHLLGAAGVVRVELSMLLHALDYHLLRSGGRINYFHQFIKRAVEKRYLGTPELRRSGHDKLAQYFLSLTDVMETHHDSAVLREMLYQLMRAGRNDELLAALTSPVIFDTLYTDETEYEYLRYLRGLGISDDTSLFEHLITDDPARALRLSKLYRALGKWDDARKVLDIAIIGKTLSDADEILLYGALGRLQVLRGDPASALESFERKRNAAHRLGNEQAEAEADGDIGSIYFDHGNLDEALKRFRSMLMIARAYNDKRTLADALTKIGQIEAQRGERKNAIHSFGEALRLAESTGDLRTAAFILGQRGLVHWNSGEFADAMKCYLSETEAMEAIGDRLGEAQAIGKIGLVLLDEGRLDEAESSFRSYLERTESLGYARGIGFAQGDIGIVELWRKRYDKALRLFHDALTTHKRIEFIYGIALWNKWIAETLIERGSNDDLAAAKIHNDESKLIAQNIGSEDIIFDTEITNARIARAAGLDPESFLLSLLNTYTKEHQQASIWYWLWKLCRTDKAETNARSIYTSLAETTNKHLYRERRDEL